jgi:NAD(P)-dependent dehydrogenase (short-subunit alcohol dehydrogenase family)
MATILITGATDGLGRGVARELADRGDTLLLHGRDPGRGHELVEQVGGRFYQADFSSLAQVRAMAEKILSAEDRLDVLVNNAGIGTTLPGDGARMVSEDGYELRFQVNYLAGFLLARLLDPLLRASAPARVVNVSSAGQMPIEFEDVMLEREYNPVNAYCQSKLAQIMHTFDLAAAYPGNGVCATCLHPSTYMPTKIVLHAGAQPTSSLEQGVTATARLIAGTSPEEVNGRYFNVMREAPADGQAYDEEARARLRELSEALTGLS